MLRFEAGRPEREPVSGLILLLLAMRFVLPTTYARTRIYRPRQEAVPLEPFTHADVTSVQVAAADGLSLHGWFALSRVDHDGPRPLILYFPGTSGHRGYRREEVELFARLGCDVLLVDYRGYAENAGQPSERHQARDARAVWAFAVDQLHIPPERIVVCGESIGGAVGVRLVAELCRKNILPGGLILQATFNCMLDVVSQFFPRILATIFLVDRYPSIRRIGHVRCPILSIHGTRDRLIPVTMGRQLFDAAPPSADNGQAKHFLELTDSGHNDIVDGSSDVVELTLAHFLKQALANPASNPDVSARRRPGVMQPQP